MPSYLSLFAGIGGMDLGLDRAGWTCVGQVEIDPFCRSVLARHWPEVPRHDDVRTCVEWWLGEPRPAVDMVAGGFPCQPVSNAGSRLGEDDKRWLWPAMAAVVAAIRPEWVLFENVPGLRTRGLASVLDELDHLGYVVRVGPISACAVGAPHTRERLFGVAHAPRRRRQPGGRLPATPPGMEPGRRRPQSRGPWSDQPRPHGVAYGVPYGVDRRRALGNAVVPQVAEHIGRMIVEAARA